MQLNIQTKVKYDLAIRVAIDGSFQRGNIYSEDIDEKKRIEFRNYLAEKLMIFNEKIVNNVLNDFNYYDIIIEFSNEVSKQYQAILNNGRFRIGTSQKLLNLFWKFSWIMISEFPKPLHCPFDGIIINKLGNEAQGDTWSYVDNIEIYKKWVRLAKDKTEGKSIAEWELKVYLDAVSYIK